MGSIASLVLMYCALYNMDPRLVTALIQHESGFNPNAIGAKGEIGLMQLRPEYTPVPRSELFKPDVNIHMGIKYLAEVRDECKYKDKYTYLICYNLGVARGNTIKHPELFPYYKEIMKIYNRK